MRRTWAIGQRVLREQLRGKRSLALMFLAPILILFLMKLIFSASATTNVKIATVGVPNNVRTALNDVNHVAIVNKNSQLAARRVLHDQQVDAIVHKTGPNRYSLTYANTDATKTNLTKQAFKAALAANGVKQLQHTISKLSGTVTQLSTTIGKMQAASGHPRAESPSQTTPKPVASVKMSNHYVYGDKNTGFFDKIVPILMGFFVFFFVFLISGMALLNERTSGTLDRVLATPVRRSEIVFGYMLSYGILALIQTIIIVITTIYLLGVEIIGSLVAVMVINFILALVALAFGILMSTFAASEFQMMQFIPIIIVPQIFFSGIIPMDSLAPWVQGIAYVLPLKYAGDALTQIVMHGTKLTSLGLDIGVLLLFLIVLTAINVRGLRRYRKV